MSAMPHLSELRDTDLPAISPDHAAYLNRFFRPRMPLAFSIGDLIMTVDAALDGAVSEPVAVTVAVDGERQLFVLSQDLVDAVLAVLDPALDRQALTSQTLALLLEYAAAPAITALEATAGVSIRFAVASAVVPALAPNFLSLPFSVDAAGEASIATLHATSACAVRLLQLLDKASSKPPRLRALPLPVSLRQMAMQLTLDDIKSLGVGDVIMSDDHSAATDMAALLIGRRLAAPVRMTPGGCTLLEPPKPASGSSLQWCMDMPSPSSPDHSLDQLPVQLVIEIGRLDLPLAEVEALGAGSVLPLGRRLEDGVDILANGRRIGRGTLVTIGDSLGVRVVRLGSQG
jgi:type III secretion protein Q